MCQHGHFLHLIPKFSTFLYIRAQKESFWKWLTWLWGPLKNFLCVFMTHCGCWRLSLGHLQFTEANGTTVRRLDRPLWLQMCQHGDFLHLIPKFSTFYCIRNMLYVRNKASPWLPAAVENFLWVQLIWYRYSKISLRSYLSNALRIMATRCIVRALDPPWRFDSINAHLSALLILTSLTSEISFSNNISQKKDIRDYR